jgi:hypothetical protein
MRYRYADMFAIATAALTLLLAVVVALIRAG